MRQLFRRRHRAGAGLRVIGASHPVGALALSVPRWRWASVPSARGADPSIRITSPLGRTGLPGTIRIVARLDGPSQPQPLHVQFYVDKLFLSADTDGPPYDALWSDENPFEARELMVEAELPSGTMIRDTMLLKPLEVEEATSVTSVSVDAVGIRREGPIRQGPDRQGHSASSKTAKHRRSTIFARTATRPSSPCWWTAARAWRFVPTPFAPPRRD